MSRHRSAYTADDLDDYYDEEDDYYEEEDYGQQQYDEVAPAGEAAPRGPEHLPFVMAALGEGSYVSEASVQRMFQMFDYDVLKTIEHFEKKKAPVAAAAVKLPPAKAVSLPKAAGGGAAAAAAKAQSGGGGGGGQKKKAAPVVPLEAAKKQSALQQDIAFLGFESEAKSLPSPPQQQEAATAAAAAAAAAISPSATTATLHTDNAPLSDDEYDAEDAPAVEAEAVVGEQKPHLTMIVSGHVDAGKSTLVGNLLHKVGQISSRTIEKYQKKAQEIGKGSFALAWVMDESESERAHGVTIDVAERHIETPSRHITVLDAPGHRDYIPHMISGATQADVALLVVPASVGEFESSMGEQAQTREHAVLLKALGVTQVVVVVNKMDKTNPPWCQARFAFCCEQVSQMLQGLDFSLTDAGAVRFVPVSGFSGDNLVAPLDAALCPWWCSSSSEAGGGGGGGQSDAGGITLLQGMDSFVPPVREMGVGKPLRALILSVLNEHAGSKGSGGGGVEVRVHVLQGKIREGKGVSLASAAGAATVRKITAGASSTASLCAGECGNILLVDRSGRSGEEMSLSEGMVLCKGPPLVRKVSAFRATILTMVVPGAPPLIPGASFELYVHGQEVPCVVTKILSTTTKNSSTGVSSLVKKPKCVSGGKNAKVEICIADRPVCVEVFRECRGLGRFALRSQGKTQAVGIVERLL